MYIKPSSYIPLKADLIPTTQDTLTNGIRQLGLIDKIKAYSGTQLYDPNRMIQSQTLFPLRQEHALVSFNTGNNAGATKQVEGGTKALSQSDTNPALSMPTVRVIENFDWEVKFRDHINNWNRKVTHDVLNRDRTKGYFAMSAIYEVGDKELENGMIIYVNGIRNKLKDAIEAGKVLSKYAGGAKVTVVYNASHGRVNDFIEAAKNLKGVATTPSKLLKDKIESACKIHPNDFMILVLAHSQGTACTNNTLPLLSEEIRRQIEVGAFAPSAYIDDHLCKKLAHFRSENDTIVPFLDKNRIIAEQQGTVHVLEPARGASRFNDHPFLSGTNQKPLKDIINVFINSSKSLTHEN